MKKPLRKARYVKVKRSERDIEEFNPSPTVKTKLSKKEYEKRRDIYDSEEWREEMWDEDYRDQPWFQDRNYDDYVAWGGSGGRKVKWKNDAERKKASRIKAKLSANQLLKEKEKIFLKTLSPDLVKEIMPEAKENKLGRPRKYHSERAATAAERKRQQRTREKLKDKEEEED